MIADRLRKRIEENWEEIVARVMADRDASPHLPHYQLLSEEETRERVRDLTKRLADWMVYRDEIPHAEHFENLGRRRFNEGVPLHEVVLKINILKHVIRRYASEQNYSLTAVEIYDEMEMLRTMAAFFDLATFRIAKGYEAEAASKRVRETDPILRA